jgi:hypothetical protein
VFCGFMMPRWQLEAQAATPPSRCVSPGIRVRAGGWSDAASPDLIGSAEHRRIMG